ncbi:MAG: hypothetical protein DBX55_09410 [Verrucomicrobia bacterium]|nr:MAG: hypothetical protein DBX55_09410 [Verrucomicrobiota bacterium]
MRRQSAKSNCRRRAKSGNGKQIRTAENGAIMPVGRRCGNATGDMRIFRNGESEKIKTMQSRRIH